MTSKTTVITPLFTANYPQLLSPKKNDLNGRDEFSVVALFKKGESLKVLEDACAAAVIKKWPDPASRPKGLKSPFRKQEERAKEIDGKRVMPAGHEEGAVFCTFKCKDRPGVVDASSNQIMDSSLIYSGMKGIAQVTASAYDQKGNRGVSLYLNHFMKREDGEALGGKTTAEAAFASVAQPAGQSAADIFA